MRLSIADRICFEAVLPDKGNMAQQLMVRDIRGRTSISPVERKRIKLQTVAVPGMEPGQVHMKWDEKKAKLMDPQFTGAELDMLKQQVKALDEAGEVKDNILDLCMKIRDARTAETPKKKNRDKKRKRK
jgi:hypothetical protein